MEQKGKPAEMPQIPLLLILAKFSALSKQFPHLGEKKPHTTQPQTKTNKKTPACVHGQIKMPLDVPCPHLPCATGPGHHPAVTPTMGTSSSGGLMVAQGTPGDFDPTLAEQCHYLQGDR